MKREIDWWGGLDVTGRLRLEWTGRRKPVAYEVEVVTASYRYEHLGVRLHGTARRLPGEGMKPWTGRKTFYARDLLHVTDIDTGEAVTDLKAWALAHCADPPLVRDPSDDGLTIGLIYRQRSGRGDRIQRYVVRPKEIYFAADGSPEFLRGGSLIEEAADGQLNWERRFDDPARFIAFYDRETGEIIDDPKAWLTEQAARWGERIFGINR